jgi:thioredoxin 1
MADIQNITDENFERAALKSEKVFVLDFYSDWCQPCKMMSPILDEIARDLSDSVGFGKMDISANPQTPTNYGVMAIPTFIIFKDGEEVKRLSGITPKEKFKSEIKRFL